MPGFCLPIVVSLLCSLQSARAQESSPAAAEFFEKQIRPLLVDSCLRCHGDTKPKGALRLTSRDQLLKGGNSGPAIIPGKPDESLLIRAICYEDSPKMPPKGKLSARQIDVFKLWVKMGAPWPEGAIASTVQRQFWSFRPLGPTDSPAVKNDAWAQSAIDRFILNRIEAKALQPAPPAGKRTLIRRATFDLIGLPPTPREIDDFLADDSQGAFARVIDRLLASPLYGERWGRHWLDVMRYADARDLIQLPAESDFREAWRYRDWVVDAFNRDLPYTDFIKYQIAGDLLQPREPDKINKDALVATGMLAIADFVPGDTDKEMMIADYVNDEIDVVGRGIIGLTLACARCHDHKFDPISNRDYYALAGIFFSTRLIPAPIEGNTPLIRVPLLAPAEIAKLEAQQEMDKKRREELERLLVGATDREYRAELKRLISETSRYLLAAVEYRNQRTSEPQPSLSLYAKQHGLNELFLTGWVEILGKGGAQKQSAALTSWCQKLRDQVGETKDRSQLEQLASELERSLVAVASRKKTTGTGTFDDAARYRFRADDPGLVTSTDGHVSLWPNRADGFEDAVPASKVAGPLLTTAVINGSSKPVLSFDGKQLLEALGSVPPEGALFAVFQEGDKAPSGRRLVGWEDSNTGRHGLGLMLNAGGLQAIVRKDGVSGDIAYAGKRGNNFDILSLTWGAHGVTMHRNQKPAGANAGIKSVSADPAIQSLRIGGPGSGSSPWFQGALAELRVYDRQPDDMARSRVETDLHDRWCKPTDSKTPTPDYLADTLRELISSRGPFWPKVTDKTTLLPPKVQSRLSAMRKELAALKKKPAVDIPRAVVVQDGGPKGSKHEGFKDAAIFLRGDPKNLGAVVPRGFPEVLAGNHQPPIAQGSGRLQLSAWLTRPDHPLTARVLVNRLWQHHFGEGIVRTANNFGERGARPTHPELLNFLADRFVQSGWSIKAMHRMIMLSATYQQSSKASADSLAVDPENQLFARMNRRRLEAEAIRDSLLAVADRLDSKAGGPSFQDLAVPRRTLYFMSVRTGEKNSKFGSLFDRPDPASIIEKRGVSTTVPQALFLLNDPFMTAQAKSLAERVIHEAGNDSEQARIRTLYSIVLGRQPTPAELNTRLPLTRYGHMILCTNEFLYVD